MSFFLSLILGCCGYWIGETGCQGRGGGAERLGVATSSAGESFVIARSRTSRGGGVAADQPELQDLDVRGHALTMLGGADDPLTMT